MRVEGRITEVDQISRGIKYTLDGGSGRIILLLWQNVMGDANRNWKLLS